MKFFQMPNTFKSRKNKLKDRMRLVVHTLAVSVISTDIFRIFGQEVQVESFTLMKC